MNRVSLILVTVFLCSNLLAQLDSTILTEAEQMPYFSGCEHQAIGSDEKRNCSDNALVTFIANHLVYPTEAKDQQVEGTVFVSFVVNVDGTIADQEVLYDIGAGCGNAALKVLEQMPVWECGQEAGRPVAVKLNLPIRFSLKSANNGISDKYKLAWGLLRSNIITKEQIKNNLESEIVVRDQLGNTLPLSALTFSYEKKNFYIDAQSKGHINIQQKKLTKKCRVGGILIVSATIQDKGNLIDIDREFEIVK